MKAKEKLAGLVLAGLILITTGVVTIAQKHFMVASAARPEVKMALSGGVERDSKLVALDKSIVIKPGEVLDWTIDAVNSGSAPAIDYKAIAQIPRGTEFIAGSAKADGATAQFSIDGGKSYSVQPMIAQKQADGSVKPVAAPLSMYTHVRYELANSLAQGGKFSASYKVRVK